MSLWAVGVGGLPGLLVGLAFLGFTWYVYEYEHGGGGGGDDEDDSGDDGGSRLGDNDPASPLVLDLNGDGIHAYGLTFFDHEGDGWSELSAWANEDDGVLVWDRNGDGVINDGSELFGNNTRLADGSRAAHGFAVLAELDDSGNGLIDRGDSAWDKLQVLRWSDTNGNGFRDEGEEYFQALEDFDIFALDTDYTNSNYVDPLGNEHRQVGRYGRETVLSWGTSGGTTLISLHTMTDVWFATESSIASYDDSDIPEHSEEVLALPDLLGRGRMYNLRDAMALDDAVDEDGVSRLVAPFYGNARTETRSLREMVAAFVAVDDSGNPALDAAERLVLAEKILLRWAGAEGARAEDYGTRDLFYTKAHQIAVLEAFQGSQWREDEGYRRPNYPTSQKVNREYMNYLEGLYASLMLSSHLSDLDDEVLVVLKEGAEEDSTDFADYEMDFSGAKAILDSEDNARLSEFLRSLAATYGNNEWVLASLESTASAWVYEYVYYSEYLERGVFDGVTQHQNDFVGDCGCSGGLRDNVFQTIDGGNDRLEGRGGDDIYHLGYGTGHDRIEEQWRDSDFAGDDGDAIKVAPGIGVERVRLSRTRDDLVVLLLNDEGVVSDSLTVAGYYIDVVSRIERVEFANGTVWGADDFADAVFGDLTSGDDVVLGDSGSQVLAGFNGGDDTLRGAGGSDVYLFGRGSGHDVVDAGYRNTADSDEAVVRLQDGITSSDVSLSRNKFDLIINLHDSEGVVSDTLTIKNYYVNDAAKVARVELSDGVALWGVDDFAGVEWDAPVYAEGGATIVGNHLNNYLRGSSSTNDVFDGNAGGNDTLWGYGGDDVYWLGYGTGFDIVDESYRNAGGDAGDVVKVKAGITAASVRLVRSNNGHHLYVQLLGEDGSVTDHLKVANHFSDDSAKVERLEFADGLVWGANEFMQAVAVGTDRNDYLRGLDSTNDVFDGIGGGNDWLRGRGGDDVYWLGYGTGFDTIEEHYKNVGGDDGDVIKIKSSIAANSIRLVRSNNGQHLYVQLLGEDGSVTDHLKVVNHFSDDVAKVERLEFADGLVWGANEFMQAALVGTHKNDYLRGSASTNDVFDGNAGGNDTLWGYGGDDVYWLGYGTGFDIVDESYRNAGGDAGDVVKVKAGITAASVRLVRSNNGHHLYVQLLNEGGAVADQLTVAYHFTDDSAKVEQIEADGKVLLETQYQGLIDAMATWNAGNSDFSTLGDLYDHYWADDTTIAGSY